MVEEGASPISRKGIRGVMQDMGEGLRYVMSSTWVWVTIVVSSAGNIFLVAPLTVAMPKLVHDAYGAGVWLLGTLATASAIGSILGVLIVGQMKQMRWRGLKKPPSAPFIRSARNYCESVRWRPASILRLKN